MYKIRRAKAKDVNSLISLAKKLSGFERKMEPAFHKLCKNSDRVFRKYFQKHIKRKSSLVLIAEHDGMPIGFLVAKVQKRPSVFELRLVIEVLDVFVDGRHRKAGVGTRLLNHTIKRYSRHGFRYFSVYVLSKNKNAGKFYKKLGFRDYVKVMYKKV